MTKAKEFFKRIVAGLLSFSMVVSLFEGMDLVLPSTASDAEAVATQTSGNRLFWRYDNGQVGNVVSKNQIHVFAFEGETLCFGSSVYNSAWNLEGTGAATGDDKGTNDIVLIDLKGKYNAYDVKNTGDQDGFIKDPNTEKLIRKMTYEEVKSGETITDSETKATYKPFTYQVTQTGVYTFEFRSPVITGSKSDDGGISKEDDWSVKKNTAETNKASNSNVASWDITIFDEYGDRKTGRTYCDFIALQSQETIIEDYYVVTNDSYIYNLKFKSATPYTFTFFANNRGIVDNANGNILYKSVKAISNSWTSDYNGTFGVHGFTYKQPSSADTDLSKTFKIFLEEPDPALEGYLYKKARAPEAPTNVKFLGTVLNDKGDVVTGAYEGVGGYFSFDVKEATTATLRLEFKNLGNGKEYAPVEISDIVTPNSTNVFYWDGRDGNGEIIPQGDYTPEQISYSVITKAGEIHFPIFDMEYATGGITITRISPIYDAEDNQLDIKDSIYDATKSVVYYDESDIYYGDKIGITATSTEADVNVWKSYTSNFAEDENGYGKYFVYNNFKLGLTEYEVYNDYFKGQNKRVGDHSHTSNPIDYSVGTAIEPDQRTMIEYLDSAEHPVGQSLSSSNQGTTTDYGIANYWTFTPSTLASKPSDTSETLEIVEMPKSDGKSYFNLRGFAFFDEKVDTNNIIDKENGNCDGIYNPQQQGDHALSGVMFQLFKETTDEHFDSGKKYYIAEDNSNPANNRIPREITTSAEFESERSKTTVYELIDEQASSLKGEYFFTGLEYDETKGTKYMLGFVRPDINYELTTALHDNKEKTDDNSYILYSRSNTFGVEAQEIIVGNGTGMIDPQDNPGKDYGIDDHGRTITMADVGYYFEDSTTVTMEKEYKTDTTDTTGESATPKYTVFELSYCVNGDNRSAVYGHRVMSVTEQFKYSYRYLPKEIDPEFIAGEAKSEVNAYYVSAEYYIFNNTIYKAVFSFDESTGEYLSNKAAAVYYHKLEDEDKNGIIDEKDVAAKIPGLTATADGAYNFDKLGSSEEFGGGTYWELAKDDKSGSAYPDDYHDVAPFVTTIDRETNPSEDKMTVTNSSLPGTIEITKVDERTLDENENIVEGRTKYLEGATFRLYQGTKAEVQENVEKSLGTVTSEKEKAQQWLKEHQLQSSSTRSNGQLIFTGLQLQDEEKKNITYTIRETFAPTGYTFSPEDAYREVTGEDIAKANGYYKLTVKNYEPTANLTIRKVINGRGWVNAGDYKDSFTFDISIKREDITDTPIEVTEPQIQEFVDLFNGDKEITIDAGMTHPVDEDGNIDTSAMELKTNIPENYFGDFNSDLAKGKLTFPGAGTYKFTITENKLDESNLLYKNTNLSISGAKYEVTLTVNEDGEGEERKQSVIISSVERVIEDGDGNVTKTPIRSNVMTFTNTYNVEDVDAKTSYTIEKVITGREWVPADSFEFELSGNDAATNDAMRKGDIEFKDLLGKFGNSKSTNESDEEEYPTTYNITVNNDTHSQNLGEILFKHLAFSGDIGSGTVNEIDYCFKITEKSTGTLRPGFKTYDNTTYYLKVELDSTKLDERVNTVIFTVYKNSLESDEVGHCTITYNDKGEPTTDGSTVHNEASHNFKFTNNYEATGTFTPTIKKELIGRDWYPKDSFDFNIEWNKRSGQDGYVTMPTSNSDISIEYTGDPTDAHTGTFGGITINKAGTYNFTISETPKANSGIADVPEFYLIVQATDNATGKLELNYYIGNHDSDFTIGGKTEIEDYDGAAGSILTTFANYYSESGTLSLGINKTLEGRAWASGDEFTFTVTPNAETLTKYNNKEYTVKVTDEDGTPISGVEVDSNGVITLTVDKKSGLNIAELLTFSGNADKEDNTYTFTVAETAGTGKIIYDDTKYTVTVATKREIDDTTNLPTGKLTVTASYVIAGGEKTTADGEIAAFDFTNQAYVNDSLTISKSFTGREWNDEDAFTIEVTRTDGEGTGKVYISNEAGASTTTPVEKGDTQTVTFTKVDHADLTKYFTFLKPGTYEFTVKEQLPEDKSGVPTALSEDITYDQTEYEWTVTVTDDGGELSAASTLEKVKNIDGETPSAEDVAGETAAFENTYACRDSIRVQKQFTGRSEKWTDDDTGINDQFYFTVTPNNEETQNAVDSKKITFDRERIELNGKDNFADEESKDPSVRTDILKVLFSKLDFSSTTEYKYEFLVKEDPEHAPIKGVTYDLSKYTVTMTVTQKSDNTYDVKTTYKKDDGTEADKLTFHNKYEPTKASVKLSLTKLLTGRKWTADDEFKFTVTPDGENPTDDDYGNNGALLDKDANPQDYITVKGSDDESKERTADFYFQYSKPGEYTYIIEEVIPDDTKGIKYDITKYKLVVTVADKPTEGVLSIKSVTVEDDPVLTRTETLLASDTGFAVEPVAYETDELISFTNEYSANLNDINNYDGACWIWIKKTLEGRNWLDGDKFKFIIEAEEDDPFTKEAIANDQLQFAEKHGTDFEERLTVFVSNEDYDNKTAVEKPDTSFYRDSLRIQFVNVTFDDEDEHTYQFKIREDIPQNAKDNGNVLNGITYDDTVYHVSVTVKDNNGTLSITEFKVTDDEDKEVEFDYYPNKSHKDADEYQLPFTNVYNANGNWTFAIDKTITGRPWNKDESFDFEFTLDEDTDIAKTVDMPVELTDGKLTVTDGDGDSDSRSRSKQFNVHFGLPGDYEYTFKLKEIKPEGSDGNGLTYDPYEHIIKVSVKDNGKGELSVDSVTVDGTEADISTKIPFTNEYSVSTVWTPKVQKVLEGRGWNTDDGFEFTLTPDTSDTITNNAVENGKISSGEKTVSATSAAAVSFGDITIYSDGNATQTYKFILSETSKAGDGISYSEDYVITLKVTDDRHGKLSTEITSVVGVDSKKAGVFDVDTDTVTVINTYSVTATLDAGSINIIKEIEGREWLSGDTFEFTITADDTTAVDKGDITLPTGKLVISNDKRTVGIGAITFKSTGAEEKTYTFTIAEVSGTIPGLTYADPQTVTVTVKDDLHGKIEATVDKSSLTFTNVYTATGELSANAIGVESILKGRQNDKWLDTDKFDYTIEGADESTNAAIADKHITFASDNITVESDTDGHKKGFGAISFSGIEFPTKDGKESDVVYNFKVSQNKGEIPGITYDAGYYTVTVTLTDNKDGSLDADVTDVQRSEGDISAASLKDYNVAALPFDNVYKATGTWSPDVNKTLTGRAWNSDTDKFTFNIAIADGYDYGDSVVMPEDTHIDVTHSGISDKFNAITFNKAGTYKFTVSESVPEDKKGIEYPAAQDITVTATDNTNGTLTVTARDDDTVEFTNKYSAGESLASGSISVEKKLEGREWQGYDKYVFSIAPSEESPETLEAVGDGRIKLPGAVTVRADDFADGKYSGIFDAIEFSNIEFETNRTTGETMPKVFSFVMTEVDGGKKIDGVTYSDHRLYFNIVLEDKGDGTLKASLQSDYHFKFTNEYQPKPATLDGLSVEKILNGRQWLSSDEFYFDISGADENTINLLKSGDITVTDGNTASADSFNKTAQFGTLIFNNKGDYTFTVKERYGGQPLSGVKYDDSEWTISVSVTDDLLGQLSAKVTSISKNGDKADKIQFTNTYSASAGYGVQIEKLIDGREWNNSDSFEFTIEPIGNTAKAVEEGRVIMPEDNTLILDELHQSGTFAPITFNSNGTLINIYTFRVTEKLAGETHDGLTYDTSWIVLMAVMDSISTGKLTPVQISGARFINTYSAEGVLDGGKNLVVTKDFSGRDWIGTDKFTFTISGGNDETNAAIDAGLVTLPEDITIGYEDGEKDYTKAFGDIGFISDGSGAKYYDYEFIVKEVYDEDSAVASVDYDTAERHIKVHVIDDQKGNLYAEITNESEYSLTFTNTYHADSITWPPVVSKILSGRDWVKQDSYKFNLSLDTDKLPDGVKAEDVIISEPELTITADSEAPDSSTRTKQFGEIEFTKPGRYVFTISEQKDTVGLNGIEYSPRQYKVTVDVTDDTIGHLKQSVYNVLYTVDGGKTYSNYGYDTFRFVNHYGATGVWTPVVRKRLVGREWSEHDSFEFELTLDTDRLPDGVSESDVLFTSRNVTITKGEGESAAYTGGFGDVTFTKPGTYYFTIAELPQKIPNNGIYEATEPYDIAVHVNDEDNDGVLTVQPEIILDGETVSYADVSGSLYRFTDIYSASGTWPPIISKSLAGRKWKDTDKFTFEIEALSWSLGDISDSGLKLPEPLTVTNTDLDENTVVARFGNVVFSQPGVYTFAVREIEESIARVNYDPTEYKITVEVTDDTYGGLHHSVISILRDGEPLGNLNSVLFFTNRYAAKGELSSGSINVEKEIDGRDWLNGDSFSFNIAAADSLTRRAVAAGLITLPDDAEIKYDDAGHTASFDDIKFNISGFESVEYTFAVTENNESAKYPWMSFDGSEYTVKVAVTDNLDGTLNAEVTSVTKDGKTADIVFVNRYSAEGAWPPLVHKELTGRAWSRADRFEFALTAIDLPDGVSESDIVLPKNIRLYAPESGNISSGQFGDVKFTKPGEYQFKLAELGGDIAGVQYSKAEYIITVSVKDEGDGTLTPTVSSVMQSGAKDGEGTLDGGYKFINTYAVKTDGLKIAVNKKLIGRERLDSDKFTFKIAPADKPTEDAVSGGIIEMPESLTASVEGKNTTAEFGGIVFNSTGEKERTYSFDITEVNTGISGIEYSDKTVTISVKVTDDLNGRITAAVVGEPEIEFTNSYTASGTLSGKDNLKVAKTFIGREWLSDDKFAFTIAPADEHTEAALENGFISLPDDLVIGYNEQGVYTSNFDDIEFLSTGNKTEKYKLEIIEVYDENDAVFSTEYDTNKYTIEVTVTDEYDGKLSAAAEKPMLDGEAVDVMSFINTYTAEGVWPPIVGKTLVGRDWTDDDSFIFRLRLAGTQPEGTDRTAVTLPPVADIEITKSDLKDGIALKQFDETTFSQPGLYVFTLDEMRRTPERGIEYSDNFYAITVKAEHDGNAEGQMDVEIESVILIAGGETVNYGNTEYFAFENVYSASGSWSAVIDKTLTGRQWLDSDIFAFDISVKVPEGVSPDSVEIRDDLYINADGENSDAYRKSFDDAVIFTKPGEYEVTVSERKLSDDNGITYDPTAKTVKVTVTDNGDGTLTVKSDSNEFTFTNAYNAVGIWPPEVDKTLTGRPWSDNDSFAFNISLVDFPAGASLDMPENLVITKPLLGNSDTYSGAFTPVKFNLPGRYEFAVTEVTDSHNGIQCDDTVYTIVVYVADDDNGTLIPGVTAVYRDGEQIDTDSTLKFTNTYSAVGVLDGGIRVEKELVGREWLDDDVFTFTVTPNEDYGEKIQLTADTADILGMYKDKYADLGSITVYEAGIYTFTVKEKNNGKGGITYDDTEYTVTLNAEDNGDGTLKLSVEGGDIKFINTYTPDPTTVVGEVQLPFDVELKGRQWQDGDEFTFTLSPAEEYGEKVQLGQTEVTVSGGGSAHFGDIVFSEAGEYTFYVQQQPGTDSSITYDDRVYEVKVTVTDDLNGSLTATVDSVNMEFVNVYNVEPTPPPSDTTAPEQTTKPDDTTAPEQTAKPDDTTAPEQTAKPDDTTAPEQTDKPDDTTAPEQTAKPDDTTAPEQTDKPDDTTAPEGENPDTGVAPDVRSCVAAAAVTFGSAMALTLRKRRKKK